MRKSWNKKNREIRRRRSPDNIVWTLELLFICTWSQVHFGLPSYMDWYIIFYCLNYFKEDFYHLQQKQTCLIYRTRTRCFAAIPSVIGTVWTQVWPQTNPRPQRKLSHFTSDKKHRDDVLCCWHSETITCYMYVFLASVLIKYNVEVLSDLSSKHHGCMEW